MEYLKEIAEQLLPVIATILSGVLLVVGAWLAKLLRTKLGLSISAEQQVMVARLVEQGVGRAEQWARSKVANGEPRPGGAEKLEVALSFVMSQAAGLGLPAMARDKITELLEAALGVRRLGAPTEG